MRKVNREDSEKFSFFFITYRDVNEKMIDFIIKTTGIKINFAVNNILKAEGTKTQLLKLSGVHFVKRIMNDNT